MNTFFMPYSNPKESLVEPKLAQKGPKKSVKTIDSECQKIKNQSYQKNSQEGP